MLAPHTSKSFAFRCQEFAGSSSMEDYYDKTYLYVYIKRGKKEQTIAAFFERAQKLREIDVIKKFEVVRNAEKTPASNYDVALIFDFDTVEALEQYQKSPQHVAFGEFVSSVRIDRACIDYEI